MTLVHILLLAGVTSGFLASARPVEAKPLSAKVTQRVVDSAVDTSLEALTQPENQQRLGAILSSPALTSGVHDLAFALVDGVLDGAKGRLALDIDAKRLWRGFDRAMRHHVRPAVGQLTSVAVDAAMATALSEDNGVRLEALTAHITRGAIRGVAQGIREDLGPALAYTIEHQLAPAGAAAMEEHVMPAFARGLGDPAMQSAVAMTMNSIARNLVRGGDAGIETAKAEATAEGKPGTMTLFGDRLSLGVNVALIVTLALAAVLVLLATLLFRSNRGQQRLAEQGKRREAELLAVLEQLETGEAGVDKTGLRRLLKQHVGTP